MNRPLYVRGTMVEDGQVRDLVIVDGVVADATPLPSREPDVAGWVLPGWSPGHPASSSHRTAGKDPMQLAQFPLAVPYLLNPVGIVGLMTISAEAKSLSVFAVELGILVFVLLLDVVVFRWANRVSDKHV
jgi:hypothetical protein